MADRLTVEGVKRLWDLSDGVENRKKISGLRGIVQEGEEITKGNVIKEMDGTDVKETWVEIAGGTKKGYIQERFIKKFDSGIVDILKPETESEAIDIKSFAAACVRAAIAKRTNAAFLFAVAWIESGGQWTATKVKSTVDAGSGATGVFQFLPATWENLVKLHGVEEDIDAANIKFPISQCIFAAIQAAKAGSLIQGFMGRPVSALDLYLAHLFGPNGAKMVLDARKSNKNAKIETTLKRIYEGKDEELNSILKRKADLLTKDGPVSVEVFAKRCIDLLAQGFAKTKEVADSIAPKSPATPESALGGVGSTQPHASRILEVAKKFVGRPYENIRVDYAVPNWKGAFDCAEYATYCTYQAYGFLLGTNTNNVAKADAWTGHWKTDAEKKGLEISIEEALNTAGAFVLRYPKDGKMGHIGITVGDGKNIYEAHSTAKGVIFGSALGSRKWDTGVRLPDVEYGQPSTKTMRSLLFKLTDPPSGRSDAVEQIQKALQKKGYLTQHDIHGVFDTITEHAVLKFQEEHKGLIQDGEVGPKTGSALLGSEGWNEIQGQIDSVQDASTASHDILTLARTIYGEARGETKKGREAVGHVILNRAESARYPNTIAQVCLEPWQFSCWNTKDPNRDKIRNIQPNSGDADFNACFKVAMSVAKGDVPDHADGALHYHAKSMSPFPSWSTVEKSPKRRVTAKLGGHIFYAGIS